MSLKPIKLDNPRVWRTYLGGHLLDEFHNIDSDDGHFPEEWIMSNTKARNPGHENEGSDGLSKTSNNETLASIIERDPEMYLGENRKNTGVLVKLLDSAERLGIQVHPDREKAKNLFSSEYGKTECWYILGTRTINNTPPCVYLGFKEGITKERWRDLFEKQDIDEMLNSIQRFDVKVGDTILVEGGVPHAIGAGCFLCEIQEPTDYTIRTEKTTPSGFVIDDMLCHQGIGFDKMFDVFSYNSMSKEEIWDKYHITPKTIYEDEGGKIISKIGYDKTPYFALEEIFVNKEISLPQLDTFYGLYVINGCGMLISDDFQMEIKKGDQIFVPAKTKDITIKHLNGNNLNILRFFGPK